MILVMLPVIAFTLSNAFDNQLKLSMQSQLNAYAYSILAITEVENSELLMPVELLETKFNVIQSGLYALITSKQDHTQKTPPIKVAKAITENVVNHNNITPKVLWRSKSLLTSSFEYELPSPKVGLTNFVDIVIDNKPHSLLSYSVSFSSLLDGKENLFNITLHIVKDKSDFLVSLNSFKRSIWGWLITLMLLFILVQILWLLWTLKPLKSLQTELSSIEKGLSNKVEKDYPVELKQVIAQLNTLLLTEQTQRTRYRNSLANLAHSLKNPLAVIQSQPNLNIHTNEQLNVINKVIEHQLKKAQSAGESSWHLGIKVAPVIQRLVKTLDKLYQDKSLHVNLAIDSEIMFKGDEADLLEMCGNLLDNAYKAAISTIRVDVSYHHIDKAEKLLIITIEDDGIGINEKDKNSILNRGKRADTYSKGHGIGLAIVRDLVDSYQGSIDISKSTVYGGALFTIKFKA